ncbi:DivIVA domain-containing protein [Arthrobacter sp. SA17]
MASLPPVLLPAHPKPSDVDHIRFALGLRGYRMDQVDQVLDELRDELAGRTPKSPGFARLLVPLTPLVPAAPPGPPAPVPPPDPRCEQCRRKALERSGNRSWQELERYSAALRESSQRTHG